jgi:hypothetical protein
MNRNLEVGDTLYRTKGIVKHVGLLIGENQVLHNSPNGNVQVCTWAEYSEGKTVKIVSNSLGPFEKLRLLNQAEQLLKEAKGYGVFTFNCEHLVSLIQSGKPTSKQLQGAAAGAAIGLLFALCTKSQNKAAYTAAGALLGCTTVNAARKYDFMI